MKNFKPVHVLLIAAIVFVIAVVSLLFIKLRDNSGTPDEVAVNATQTPVPPTSTPARTEAAVTEQPPTVAPVNDSNEDLIDKPEKAPGEREIEEAETELVITALYMPPFLEEAISRYAVTRPDISITKDLLYQTAEEGRAAVYEGAPERFMTQLMSNDVGDIVVIGSHGYDFYSLLNADIFIDLSEYVTNDKSYAELNHQALDGLNINGTLKGLPVELHVGHQTINLDFMNDHNIPFDITAGYKWSDVLKMAVEYPVNEGEYFFNSDPYSFLTNICYSNCFDLIDINDKSVNLRQDWFISLVDAFKEAVLTPGVFYTGTYTGTGEEELAELNNKSLFNSFISGNILNDHIGVYEDNMEIIPMLEGEMNRNIIFLPYLTCSISANSEKQNDAWEFLSFLLEAEQQSMSELVYTPINNRAIEQSYNLTDNVPPEVLDKTLAFIGNVDYLYHSYTFYDDICVPIMQYVNDEFTLDEALELAEENMIFRLNE